MPLELYLAFVAATAVLILIPGPAVALIVATALAHGARGALVSVAGVSYGGGRPAGRGRLRHGLGPGAARRVVRMVALDRSRLSGHSRPAPVARGTGRARRCRGVERVARAALLDRRGGQRHQPQNLVLLRRLLAAVHRSGAAARAHRSRRSASPSWWSRPCSTGATRCSAGGGGRGSRAVPGRACATG